MRILDIDLVVSKPNDTEDRSECPGCGFDSVLRFPVKALSAVGVSDFGFMRMCIRCRKAIGHEFA